MISRIVFGLALALPSVCAALEVQDLPKRKAGLWQMQSRIQGFPGAPGPIQVCTDEETDSIMQSRAESRQWKCSVTQLKKEADRLTVISVCKREAMTTKTTAVFTGSFESSYRGSIQVAYDPPMHGMKKTNMVLTAKWLGPCKPGQKPGDVSMPGGGTKNIRELNGTKSRHR